MKQDRSSGAVSHSAPEHVADSLAGNAARLVSGDSNSESAPRRPNKMEAKRRMLWLSFVNLITTLALMVALFYSRRTISLLLKTVQRQSDVLASQDKALMAQDEAMRAMQAAMAPKARKLVASEYRIIHKPADGCPVGWRVLPGFFKQKDGSSQDGCENPNPASATYDLDRLEPGEEVMQRFYVEPSPPPPHSSREGQKL